MTSSYKLCRNCSCCLLIKPFLRSNFTSPGLSIGHIVQIPGVCDHQLEVIVIVDRRADVSVVFDKLANSHLAVPVLGVLQTMMHLECVQELGQHVVLSFDSLLHIGVHFGVVAPLDIVFVKLSLTVDVNLFESFLNETLTDRRHFSGNIPHEFIIGDLSIVIRVK